MSERTLQRITALRDRLLQTGRLQARAELLLGAVVLLGVIAGVWLLAAGVEAGVWMSTPWRLGVALVAFFVMLAALGYWVIRPLMASMGVWGAPSEEVMAHEIGRHYPSIADRLTNLLQLIKGQRSQAPDSLVDHAARRLADRIEPVPFEEMVSYEKAGKALRFASLPLVGVIIFLLIAPTTFWGATQRLLSPQTFFERPAPFRLVVSPGMVDLAKGDTLAIHIEASNDAWTGPVTLAMQNVNEDRVTEEVLLPDSLGQYAFTLINVRESLRYRAEAGPVTGQWYMASIVERPIVRGLQVSLDFPAYTGIPPQRLEPNAGDVQALPGTRVSVDVRMGGVSVTAGDILQDNDDRFPLILEGEEARGSFVLNREGFYQVELRDATGATNSNPIKYGLKLLADNPPSIFLIEPAPEAELSEHLEAGLRIRITDDFGFRRLRLYHRLAESRFGTPSDSFESFDLPLQALRTLDQEVVFAWQLAQTGLDPVPGDVIEYYVEVWDNDTVAGYKSSRSALHRLRLPSLAEQYEQLDEQEDEAEDALEDMLEEAREVREQFQELRDELRQKQESDWEDERQLEQLQSRQQELEEKVGDVTEQFQSMVEQMEENNLVSEETLQMYEEMQEVLQEINSPELMDALRELQESMEGLDLQQMQESLDKFEFNEQQYQQRLERTLSLFQQLRVQQDLEELARRAEELAQQQEQIAEGTEQLMENEEEGSDENAGESGEDGEQGEEGQEGEQGNESQQGEEGQEGEQGNEGQQGEQGEESEQGQQQGEEGDQQQSEQGEQGDQQQAGEQSEQQESSAEDLARQQELSKEEMEALEQLVQEAMERMQDVQNAPEQQMQQMNQQMQQQDMPQQMQENAEQLRENQLQEAQQQQQQMQQQLSQMQSQFSQMQQNMQGMQLDINMAAVRKVLSDVLMLSDRQEDLRVELQPLASNSPALRNFAQRQIELSEGLRVVSDSLQSIARKVPQMTRQVQKHAGDGLKAMSSAVDDMTERLTNRVRGHQKTSMMHLNELALLLLDLMDQMSSSSSSGGGTSMQQMIQQLQQAAGQQQQLNQQIQQMLNQMQGNRITQNMQERLRQMAAQQEQIRSDIKKLSRDRNLRGQLMGDLDRIAQQMEESIRELQRGRPGNRMIERQQQILTRMLDATKSMQQRGQEKRREGQVSEERLRESPGELTPDEQAEAIRRALLEALESGYSPDYEELIRRYFEMLQQTPEDQE